MKGTKHFLEVIKNFAENKAKNDESFKAKYESESTSIEKCAEYIFGVVQKSGSNGFTGAYYDRSSLILSAKVNGKKTETIELDLKNKIVIQSRGKRNKPTPYHDKIVELVKTNINLIANEPNRKSTKKRNRSRVRETI